jgi:hypothetical protein
VQGWLALEPGLAQRDGYERLGINSVTYRDYPAALWEFRHMVDGQLVHTGDLAVLTAGRSYAVMMRTPEGQWAASQSIFGQFQQSFWPI